MKKIIINDLTKKIISEKNKIVACIGSFETYHLGHEKVFRKTISFAAKNNLKSALITFDPLPKNFFKRKKQAFLTIKEKEKLIKRYFSFDYFIIIVFDKFIAETSAEDFLNFLKENTIFHLVIGSDFVFGKNQRGNLELLQKHNFPFKVAPTVKIWKNIKLSSSLIKKLFFTNDFLSLNKFLFWNYFLSSKIIVGSKIAGTVLNCPTINFLLKSEIKFLPNEGIFFTITKIKGLFYNSITCIMRTNKKKDEFKNVFKIETHLFNMTKNLYNIKAKIFFVYFYRKLKFFKDLLSLKKQITDDCLKANVWFKKNKVVIS